MVSAALSFEPSSLKWDLEDVDRGATAERRRQGRLREKSIYWSNMVSSVEMEGRRRGTRLWMMEFIDLDERGLIGPNIYRFRPICIILVRNIFVD